MAVRYEKVVLQLEDNFSRGALTAAGSAKVLDKSLNDTGASSRRMSRDLDATSSSIDRMSGRLGLAARAVGAFGPALAPITTSLVPVLAGLAGQIGAVALGAGVMVTAFQGVGDALEKVNKAALEPTAENINAAKLAMAELAPEARKAVRAMQEWRPLLNDIQESAATGFFPGFVDGLERLQVLAPRVERIFGSVADAAGGMFDDFSEGLTSREGLEFLSWIERSAAPTLREFGATAGNVAAGLGDLAMAMGPLGSDFTSGLLASSERFAQWADNLSRTEGYREFIDYVRETGPQVVETVGSLADAILQIGEAASPLGGPVLQGIELFADAVAAVADSPLGPPLMAAVTAMSALNLATRAFGAVAGTSFRQATIGLAGYTTALRGASKDPLIAGLGGAEALTSKRAIGVGAGAAALGAGLVASNQGLEMQNTLMFAAIGMMAGPWGAAAGAAAGATLDLAAAFDEGGKTTENWRAEITAAGGDAEQLKAVLDNLRDAVGKDGDTGIWGGIKDALTDSSSELAAPALEEAKEAYDEATLSAREFASANGVATASVTELANAFRNAQEVLEGRASMRQFEESIDAARKALEKNGRTLDINTAKGRENQAALDAIAASGIAAAEDLKGMDRAVALDRARRQFINLAVAMGVPRGEARGLANDLGLLDRTNVKPKITADDGQAVASINAVEHGLNSLDGKSSTSYLNVVTRRWTSTSGTSGTAAGGRDGDPTTPQALGGMWSGGVQFFGRGGMDVANRHQPEMARGGAWRVWAEPETQGESYIPHANDSRRPRAKRILEQTADLMGGSVEWYARGGVNGGSGNGINELSKAASKAAEAMREETRARLEAVKQQRNSLRTAVRDRFRSDIFDAPDNAWGGAGSDWRSRLQSDIAQARAVNSATAVLKRKGLDGNALSALLEGADVSQIKGFASMSKRDLAAFERLYRERDRVSAATGRNAGNAAYGKQIDGIQRELRALRRTVNDSADRNARSITNGVNGSARNGSRRGGR